MRLDTDHSTPEADKPPHYEPFHVLVEATLDRSTIGRYADREEAARTVIDYAIALYNNERNTTHTLKVCASGTIDDDDLYAPNETRAQWGEQLLDCLEGMTGAEREIAFNDAVSYLLHAELRREAQNEPHFDARRVIERARDLLDAALHSFEGDRESGPYACGDDGRAAEFGEPDDAEAHR